MARPGIAYDTVRRFIDQHIGDRGTLPTIAAIVTACGGSATTVTRFRQRFLNETQRVDHNTPDSLEASVAAGAQALWNELVDALEVRERELEADYKAKAHEADAQIEHAKVVAGNAERETRETRAALAESRSALAEERRTSATLLDRLTVTEGALAQARGAVEALDTRLTENNAVLAEAEREFQARLAAEQQNASRRERQSGDRLDALRTDYAQASDDYRERVARRDVEISELKESLARERHVAGALRDSLAETQRENAAFRAHLPDRDGRIEALSAELAQARLEQRQARDALAATASQLAGAKATVQGFELALETARRDGDAHDSERAALREANAGLVEALGRLGGSDVGR